MRSKAGAALFAGLVFILVCSSSAFASPLTVRAAASAPGDAEISFSPVSVVLAPGEATTIDLVVENADVLGGWELEVTFDSAVVAFDGVSAGEFLAPGGRTAAALGPEGNPAAGSVKIGGYSYGSTSGASGAGVLARLSFHAVTGGQTALGLGQVKLVSMRDAAVLIQPAAVEPGQIVVASLNMTGARDAGTNSLALAWQETSPFMAYEVWRSTAPYLVAGTGPATQVANGGPPNCTKVGTTITCTDANAFASPDTNYFYALRGMVTPGVWNQSNRVGTFSFGLAR